MSELINNREYRQKLLKEIILELHDGGNIELAKEKFKASFNEVSTDEITQMEQSLIAEGMKVSEIQNLCDVHASLFKGSISDIHKIKKYEENEGHPVYTFKQENREIENHINSNIIPHLEEFKLEEGEENVLNLIGDFNLLWDINKHYSRKENILFTFLEKYNITAPPKVMWGVDDEIRGELKIIVVLLKNYNKENKNTIIEKAVPLIDKIKDMIFKEENILFPLCLENLSKKDWISVYNDSDEIGYSMIEPKKWVYTIEVNEKDEKLEKVEESLTGFVKMETGILSFEQISAVFNTLPFDVTFVDKEGLVKYFSMGKERIFPRTKAIIGREVSNCHPPKSVHIVEEIVADLKSGKKDSEEFWINMGNILVYIRYFAVRNDKGEYLGVLEITQNIKPIQELTGEKRLVNK